jgi:DNA repair photolyase
MSNFFRVSHWRSIMKTSAFILAISFCLVSAPLFAQSGDDTDLTQVVNLIRAEKRTVVAENLELTKEESRVFWPLYEEFQEALGTIINRSTKFIREYAREYKNLSDEKAEIMIAEFFDIESKKLELKKNYVKKLRQVLPPKKVMRYFQMENKMEAGYNHELAVNIPLIK